MVTITEPLIFQCYSALEVESCLAYVKRTYGLAFIDAYSIRGVSDYLRETGTVGICVSTLGLQYSSIEFYTENPRYGRIVPFASVGDGALGAVTLLLI